MESPEPGSPMEYDDDVVYPCKGCGEILEEGKAFELANNRWHIDCFRCNTCGTLLDSDANLLLLADGSLICNQCTYSCTACGNKIEDLAILTGDQAFCAGCFRCRNCKRKIENLRYARTSQGIFCMSCHESLMARRKKKQRSARQASNNTPSPMLALDKSLPAIPQDMDDDDKSGSGGFSETPTELSPRPARPPMRTAPPPAPPAPPVPPTIKAELSPTYPEQRQPRPYNNNRHSQIYYPDIPELATGDPEPYSFIPLVLDPSPPAPLPSTSYKADTGNDTITHKNERPVASRTISNTSQTLSELDTDRYDNLGRKPIAGPQAPQSQPPHIAYQQKDRQGSLPIAAEMERKAADKKPPMSSAEGSPYPSRTSSRTAQPDTSANVTPTKNTSIERSTADSKQSWENFKLGEVPRDRKRADTAASAPLLDDVSFSPMRTAGQDSGHTSQKRVDTSQDDSVSSPGKFSSLFSHSTSTSSSSGNPTIDLSETPTAILRKEVPRTLVSSERGMPLDSKPEKQSYDQLPPKLPRPQISGHKPSQSDVLSSSSFGNTLTDTPLLSLPLRTPVGDFSQDEDIARILGSDISTPALLKKVSSAVRHGRSFSDLAVSVENKEENVVLKNELRKSTMRIAELEMRLTMNEANSPIDPSKIEEQRTQLACLESERESRIRELEIWLAGKDVKDFDTFKKDSIRNLAKELENLRNTYEAQIQELSIQRGNLVEEIARLTRIRDQTIQDTEQLNMKNAQLMDLNNEITRQIQGKFQSNKSSFPATNGLGIMIKDGNDLLDSQKGALQSSAASTAGTHNVHDGGEDDDVIIAQPTIVNVGRKGGYIKKSWKKGGAAIIKGAGKGFNKVFATDQHGHNQQQGLQGSQYESTSNLLPPSTDVPHGPPRTQTVPDPHGGFDKIFGTQKFRMNKKAGGTSGTNGSGSFSAINSSGLLNSKEEGVVALFGSELEARAHYEGKSIPYVVSRCIQEVEARGMDFEGIYRKSGGASSMRQIQEAFERGDDLDIGDSVDICGVTSVLKQYFRKLPTPIITPAIYDEFLKTTRVMDVEKRIQEIKNIMSQLSMVHQDVLGYVIFHLRKVAEKESKNLMTTRNLAVVFAPTLMWHVDSDREMQDMHEKNNAIQFLIENGEAIFFS